VSVCRIAKHAACPGLVAGPHSRTVLWCRTDAAPETTAAAGLAGRTTDINTHVRPITATVTMTTMRFIKVSPQLRITPPGQPYLLDRGSDD
jgi:hypothetical protein